MREEEGLPWPKSIPIIEMVLRGSYSSSIKSSPFEILFGKSITFRNIHDKICGNKSFHIKPNTIQGVLNKYRSNEESVLKKTYHNW